MRRLWNTQANSRHSAPGFLSAVCISVRSRECCNNSSHIMSIATTFNSFVLYMFVHLHFSNMGVSLVCFKRLLLLLLFILVTQVRQSLIKPTLN